jgi:hypothetical protein
MVPDLRSASWPGSINILEARLDRRVLMVVGTKEGRYDKLIFRLAADFGSYDLRIVPECSSTNINFTVLDSGVVLHMTDEDNLEIFSRLRDAAKLESSGPGHAR